MTSANGVVGAEHRLGVHRDDPSRLPAGQRPRAAARGHDRQVRQAANRVAWPRGTKKVLTPRTVTGSEGHRVYGRRLDGHIQGGTSEVLSLLLWAACACLILAGCRSDTRERCGGRCGPGTGGFVRLRGGQPEQPPVTRPATVTHGTVSGASWITTGRNGNALSFDGVNDWVTVADANDLDLTAGMTIEAWVYPDRRPTTHGAPCWPRRRAATSPTRCRLTPPRAAPTV